MGTQTIAVGDRPVLLIERISGDLTISGWDRPMIALHAATEEFAVQQHDEDVNLSCQDDCRVHVPHNALVRIHQVAGDGVITGVLGALNIEEVQGDLRVARVGTTAVQHVHGDVSAGDVRGDLTLGMVEGDARVLGVSGAVYCKQVSDDLTLAGIEEDVHAIVDDHVSLRLRLKPGRNYSVKAGGAIRCRMPVNGAARISLLAGEEIVVRKLGNVPAASDGALAFDVGEPESRATLSLEAGGGIVLTGVEDEWSDSIPFGFDTGREIGLRATEFAQQVAGQIEAQVHSATSHLDARLSELMANDPLTDKVQEKLQSALEIAESKINEAMRRAEKRMQEAETRASHRAGRRRRGKSWSVPRPTTPNPSKPRRADVSDQERMAILRMVNDGKISVEQAEQLLTSLMGTQR